MPNSSGTFLSANEDPTGTLAEVEKKIARATMIPRNHGEVLHNICNCILHFVFQLFLGQGIYISWNLHVLLSLLYSFFLSNFFFLLMRTSTLMDKPTDS